MQKKCQWSSLLCLAISFPLNVICFWVSIVLSFFDPRKKEFFNFNKNCGFHDHVLITATFSSIPLHHFSFAEFLTSCLCFFIFSTKIKLQSSATTHFEDNFKHFNHMEKYVEYAYNEYTQNGLIWNRHQHTHWFIWRWWALSARGPKNHPHQNESLQWCP